MHTFIQKENSIRGKQGKSDKALLKKIVDDHQCMCIWN